MAPRQRVTGARHFDTAYWSLLQVNKFQWWYFIWHSTLQPFSRPGTRCHIRKERTPQLHRCESLKTSIFLSCIPTVLSFITFLTIHSHFPFPYLSFIINSFPFIPGVSSLVSVHWFFPPIISYLYSRSTRIYKQVTDTKILVRKLVIPRINANWGKDHSGQMSVLSKAALQKWKSQAWNYSHWTRHKVVNAVASGRLSFHQISREGGGGWILQSEHLVNKSSLIPLVSACWKSGKTNAVVNNKFVMGSGHPDHESGDSKRGKGTVTTLLHYKSKFLHVDSMADELSSAWRARGF